MQNDSTPCVAPLQRERPRDEPRRHAAGKTREDEALEHALRLGLAEAGQDLLGRAVDRPHHRDRVEQVLEALEQPPQRALREEHPGQEDDGHRGHEADAGDGPAHHPLREGTRQAVHVGEEPPQPLGREDDRDQDHEPREERVAQGPGERPAVFISTLPGSGSGR